MGNETFEEVTHPEEVEDGHAEEADGGVVPLDGEDVGDHPFPHVDEAAALEAGHPYEALHLGGDHLGG